jgi:hypothetical protein
MCLHGFSWTLLCIYSVLVLSIQLHSRVRSVCFQYSGNIGIHVKLKQGHVAIFLNDLCHILNVIFTYHTVHAGIYSSWNWLCMCTYVYSYKYTFACTYTAFYVHMYTSSPLFIFQACQQRCVCIISLACIDPLKKTYRAAQETQWPSEERVDLHICVYSHIL